MLDEVRLKDLSTEGNQRQLDNGANCYFPDLICPCFFSNHFHEMHDGNPFREMDIGEHDVGRLHQMVMLACPPATTTFGQRPLLFLISKRGGLHAVIF